MIVTCRYKSTLVLTLAYSVRVVENILPVEKKDIKFYKYMENRHT